MKEIEDFQEEEGAIKPVGDRHWLNTGRAGFIPMHRPLPIYSGSRAEQGRWKQLFRTRSTKPTKQATVSLASIRGGDSSPLYSIIPRVSMPWKHVVDFQIVQTQLGLFKDPAHKLDADLRPINAGHDISC